MGGSNAEAAAGCPYSSYTLTRTARADVCVLGTWACIQIPLHRATHIWHSTIKFIRARKRLKSRWGKIVLCGYLHYRMLQVDQMKWIYCNCHNGDNAPMLHNIYFKIMQHQRPGRRCCTLCTNPISAIFESFDSSCAIFGCQYKRTPLTGYHWTHTTEFIDVDSRNNVHLHTVCLAVEFFFCTIILFIQKCE